MASSLLFRIKSVFDSRGFKEAESSFKSTLGVVGNLTGAAAKLAFTFSTLGGITGILITTLGINLVKAIAQSVPAAAQAEVAFSRLRTQMGLLGLESTRNLRRVTEFARQASITGIFADEQIQEAVAVALRRTGNLEEAIKQVNVAQDIAAATGRDLLGVTRLLNLAQSGRAGILLQITNLTSAEIKELQKEGKILDELAKRFSGATARAADTLAGKLTTLQNVTEETTETLGQLGLPIVKLLTDITTVFARVGLVAAEAFVAIQNPVKNLLPILTENKTAVERLFNAFIEGRGLVGFPDAVQKATKDTDKLTDSINKLKTEITTGFTRDRQLELNKLLLETIDPEERNKIRREFQETETAILNLNKIVEQGGDPVTQAAQALAKIRESRFTFAKEALTDIAQDITDRDESLANKIAEFRRTQRQRNLEASGTSVGGTSGFIRDITNLVEAARESGSSVEESVKLVFENIKNRLDAIANRLGVENFLPSTVQSPVVNVDIRTEETSIRNAVRNAVQDALRNAGLVGLFDRIRTDIRRQSREDTANSNIS